MEPRDFGAFVGQLGGPGRHAGVARPIEDSRIESLHRMMRALERGDLDAFQREMHADVEVEIHAPAEFPWRLAARGHDETRALLEHNFATVIDQRPELLSVVAQGNDLVVVARERGRHRASGAPYDAHFVQILTFRDDRVARVLELVTRTRDE
jgi:uncharacterized protein